MQQLVLKQKRLDKTKFRNSRMKKDSKEIENKENFEKNEKLKKKLR